MANMNLLEKQSFLANSEKKEGTHRHIKPIAKAKLTKYHAT